MKNQPNARPSMFSRAYRSLRRRRAFARYERAAKHNAIRRNREIDALIGKR